MKVTVAAALAVRVEHAVRGLVLARLIGRLETHVVGVDEGEARRGLAHELVREEHPRVVGVLVVVEHVDRHDVARAHRDLVVARDRRLVLREGAPARS